MDSTFNSYTDVIQKARETVKLDAQGLDPCRKTGWTLLTATALTEATIIPAIWLDNDLSSSGLELRL